MYIYIYRDHIGCRFVSQRSENQMRNGTELDYVKLDSVLGLKKIGAFFCGVPVLRTMI